MPQTLDKCICSISNNMTGSAKQALINLLNLIKGLLVGVKSSITLYNTDYAEQAKLVALKLESQLMHAALDPIAGSMTTLRALFLPWADCDPAQTMMRNLSKAKDTIVEPYEKLDYEISLLEKAISERDKKLEFMDNMIDFIDNFVESLNKLCV